MKRLFLVLVIIANANLVFGQINPIPDFKSWKVVSNSRIQLGVSDCIGSYLGVETKYNNPNDSTEFAIVLSRHKPLSVSKCKKQDERSMLKTAVGFYIDKEEQDLLNKYSKDTDPFLYIEWHANGGDVNIWLIPVDGRVVFIDCIREIQII